MAQLPKYRCLERSKSHPPFTGCRLGDLGDLNLNYINNNFAFEECLPGSTDLFLKQFPSYIHKIQMLRIKHRKCTKAPLQAPRHSTNIPDDGLRALARLIELVELFNEKTPYGVHPHPHFLYIIEDRDQVHDLLLERYKFVEIGGLPAHIVLAPSATPSYYLVLPDGVVRCEGVWTGMEVFDILFKLYIIRQLPLKETIQEFYYLMGHFFFRASSLPPPSKQSEELFFNALRNITKEILKYVL